MDASSTATAPAAAREGYLRLIHASIKYTFYVLCVGEYLVYADDVDEGTVAVQLTG